MSKLKRAIFFTVAILLTGYSSLLGQQRVFINFNVQVMNEPFERPNKTWPIQNTAENIFVIDDGEYFLSRKHPITGYAVMANWENKIEEYHLKTSIKIGPSPNGTEAIGVILMASNDGKQGLIIEFNGSKDYRVKLIQEKGYEYITGGDDGWVRSFSLNGPGKSNLIEVKTQNGEYDLYFNDKYVSSFAAHELFYGNFGLFIGPETKARVDYYEVYSTRAAEEFISVDGRNYAELVRDLSKENIKLRNQVIEKDAIINDFTKGGVDRKITELETIIADLEVQIRTANKENFELKKKLEEGGRGVDPELAAFLRSTTQTLIQSNQRLEAENQELKAENQDLREKLQGLTERFLKYAEDSEDRIAELKQENKKDRRSDRRDEPKELDKPEPVVEDDTPFVKVFDKEVKNVVPQVVFKERKTSIFPVTPTISK